MSLLTCLKRFPRHFMEGCAGLTQVKFPPNIEDLGESSFRGCTSLTDVDMSSLVAVGMFPRGFMSGCVGLKSLRMPPNARVFEEGSPDSNCRAMDE